MFKFPCRLSTWWLFFPRNPLTIWFRRIHASSSRTVHIPSCSRRQTPESGSRGGPRYPYLSFFSLKELSAKFDFHAKIAILNSRNDTLDNYQELDIHVFVYLNCFIFIDGFSAKVKTYCPPPIPLLVIFLGHESATHW